MSVFVMHTFCMNIDISCYKIRVFFCLKYNSTDFLGFRLCLKKEGLRYTEIRRFLNHTF